MVFALDIYIINAYEIVYDLEKTVFLLSLFRNR